MTTNKLNLPVLMSPQRLSEYLGVSIQTLSGNRCYGKGIPYIKVGNRVRYRLQDVENFLNENLKEFKKEN